jgi:hypothetical protein
LKPFLRSPVSAMPVSPWSFSANPKPARKRAV